MSNQMMPGAFFGFGVFVCMMALLMQATLPGWPWSLFLRGIGMFSIIAVGITALLVGLVALSLRLSP